MLGKRIGLAVSDVALGAEYFELQVEHLVQFTMPVVHQTGRHDHQRPVQFATACQLTQDQRRLNRLA